MDSPTSALSTWLQDHTRFQELVHVTACTSTQALARKTVGPGCAVVWADHQTAGRGREGRSWNDSPAQDLAVTFVLRGLLLQNTTRLAAATPVAIAKTLETHVPGTRLQIKWPNDLLLHGRKISGLLIDSLGKGDQAEHLLGIGINVNRTTFPEELSEVATSLALATGREVDRGVLLQELAQNLEAILQDLEANRTDHLEESFRTRLQLLGKRVRLRRGSIELDGRLEHLDLDAVRLSGGDPVPLAHVQRLDPL